MTKHPNDTAPVLEQVARQNQDETNRHGSEAEVQNKPLIWQPQEPPFEHPDSCCHFRLDGSKHVVATRNAAHEFTEQQILYVLELLQQEAVKHNGLDYLQVFHDENSRRLWVIEDALVITVLLPEDY